MTDRQRRIECLVWAHPAFVKIRVAEMLLRGVIQLQVRLALGCSAPISCPCSSPLWPARWPRLRSSTTWCVLLLLARADGRQIDGALGVCGMMRHVAAESTDISYQADLQVSSCHSRIPVRRVRATERALGCAGVQICPFDSRDCLLADAVQLNETVPRIRRTQIQAILCLECAARVRVDR